MGWAVEKEEKIEILTSWIEATNEEREFAEELLSTLDRSSSKTEFIKVAQSRLQEHKNPWLRDNLNAIFALVTG